MHTRPATRKAPCVVITAMGNAEITITGGDMMVRCARILQCAFVAVVFQSFVGCSSSAPVQPRQWNPTPIEDVKLVAGMWEGILIQAPRLRQDDWVRVFIREN